MDGGLYQLPGRRSQRRRIWALALAGLVAAAAAGSWVATQWIALAHDDPWALDAPKRIFNFMDDQGYDADLYFTNADENTFKVVLKKLANT